MRVTHRCERAREAIGGEIRAIAHERDNFQTVTHARKSGLARGGAIRILCFWMGVAPLACGAPRDGGSARSADSAAQTVDASPVDSALDTLIAGSMDDSAMTARRTATQNARLSPLADSLARFLVFVPVTQRWFAAASRGQRMLIDLGRVDTVVGDNHVRQAAFREAVAQLAPVGRGDRLRLRGPWGSDDVTVSGFDSWSGRIVATIEVPERVDSLARAHDWLPAVAVRSDSTRGPSNTVCERVIPAALGERLTAVKDSVIKALRAAKDLPRVNRLAKSLKETSSRMGGCFENATAIMLVTLYAGDYEWVRERAFAIDSLGAVRPLSVRDLRFKSHEALGAFDADEDGDDDLAARGRATRAGALVVLRLVDAPAPASTGAAAGAPLPNVSAARLERAAAGFAWER
jgi:hypothetical protein